MVSDLDPGYCPYGYTDNTMTKCNDPNGQSAPSAPRPPEPCPFGYTDQYMNECNPDPNLPLLSSPEGPSSTKPKNMKCVPITA